MAASSWRGATIFVRCFHISPLLCWGDSWCPAKTENDSLHFYGVSFSGNMMGGSAAPQSSHHTVSNSSPVLTSISTNIRKIRKIVDSLLHLAEIAELNSGVCCTIVHGLPKHTVFKQFICRFFICESVFASMHQLWLWMYEVQRCPNWRTQVLTLRPTVWLDDKPVDIMCSENK